MGWLTGLAGWPSELPQTVDQAGNETCPGDDEAEKYRPNAELGSGGVLFEKPQVFC